MNVRKSLRFARGLPRRLARALIPDRVQLPLAFWWQNMWRALEPELYFILGQGGKSGIAIDVGANHGLYSYAFAKIFDHVEAFEPNPDVARKLCAYASEKITLHTRALSRDECETNLYTPVSAAGVEYPGWGTLHREVLPASESIRTRPVFTRSLDSYNFDHVALIKIDVEGHEIDVLEGAAETIARCRPIVLIEVKPSSRRATWNFFSARQYDGFLLVNGELQPLKDGGDYTTNESENFFWIPDQLNACPSE